METLDELARDIVEESRRRGLSLRVIGGVAVRLHCPSATHRTLVRTYGDIDLVGKLKEAQKYNGLPGSLGFEPNRPFNILNGSSYLRFDHSGQNVHLDVFLDKLEMCHPLKFADRLPLDDFTLPLSDLLLTKLQIVHLNEKDVQDIIALLVDHELADGSQEHEAINLERIVSICSQDWGWYRTVRGSLENCAKAVSKYFEDDRRDLSIKRIETILATIEEAPKSIKWKLRAAVGEKVQWYQLPEDPTRD